MVQARVPEGPEEERCTRRRGDRGEGESSDGPRPRRRRRKRLDWAALLKRRFAIEVPACPRCGGRMTLIAAIAEPGVARKILRAMGPADEVPTTAAARPPPDERFEFDQFGE